jgi:tRNA(Ile)-lysidine synthase
MNSPVETAVERCGLLRGGESVTVALSGGADSVALLHVMLSLKKRYSLTLSAAHVNHMLRGDESDRDERFVRELCGRLQIPLSVARIDVAAQAARSGESIELCARRLRYGFLNQACDGGLIATAHTADDALETLIFNLTRGTGIKGLASIPPKRGNIIRPLYMCTRADIEAYCAANSLDYVTDSTNLSDDYTRNRIRHHVVPQLKSINPSVCSAALRLMDQCRSADAMLDDMADKAIAENTSLNTDGLNSLYPPVLERVIQKKMQENGIGDIDALHVGQVCGIVRGGRGRIQLSDGYFAAIRGGRLEFILKPEKQPPLTEIRITGSQKIFIDGKKLSISVDSSEKINNLFSQNTLDYDKISGIMVLRSRTEGDRIKLKGRPTKTLKKLFCEMKIPPEQRSRIPVIADDDGVCWVCGAGADERVAAGAGTKTAVTITLGEDKSD